MIAQITLTVNEGKQLIALAVANLPKVRRAIKSGKILLKGGTTVSAIAEELVGIPLRISGRISPLGAKSARMAITEPHSILIDNGVPIGVDDRLEQAVLGMGPDDVAICGANLIDSSGRAAMMAGSALGGKPGRIVSALAAEGIAVIIPAGLEKLTPGSVPEAILAARRKGVAWSMGMATGLIPIPGRVITELTAFSLLAPVTATVIGRGGIMGAEGATTFVIQGEKAKVQKICRLILKLKRAAVSGAKGSIEECRPGSAGCDSHLGCVYAGKEKIKLEGIFEADDE
ncbi:MAG: hypothetical protein GX952_06485 [Firmicutes bacterium]|nr:hypothetical protein [Bacillota bacterium]